MPLAGASKRLKRLKTAMGSYWKKLAWIWVWRTSAWVWRRSVGVGAAPVCIDGTMLRGQRDKSPEFQPGATIAPVDLCEPDSLPWRPRRPSSRVGKATLRKVFWRRQWIVKDQAMQGRLLARTQSAGLALGAALLAAELRRSDASLGERAWRASEPHLDRRRQCRARLVRELGLPLSRSHPELSGDRQDPALPRRRRQWPAWPFEPTRRNPLGGPDL